VKLTLDRVCQVLLTEEGHELQLVTVEVAGEVDRLASDNGDVVSVEDLFGNCGCQSAEEVTSSIDDYGGRHFVG